jgi:xanthine dehydrogenase YagR molybdenum-binding subunit
VTGAAKYAAEHNVPGLAYGFAVTSAIARGRIRSIHTAEALAVPGVLDIFTHAHRPKMAASDEKYGDEVAPPGSPFRPLYDDQVRFSGQPVALVVAEDAETARFAASLVRIDYEQRTHITDFEASRGRARAIEENGESHSHKRGNAARAFGRSPIRVEVEYRMPVEHHNPMEMFGATVIWEGDA